MNKSIICYLNFNSYSRRLRQCDCGILLRYALLPCHCGIGARLFYRRLNIRKLARFKNLCFWRRYYYERSRNYAFPAILAHYKISSYRIWKAREVYLRIRLIQRGEMHYENKEIFNCRSCVIFARRNGICAGICPR